MTKEKAEGGDCRLETEIVSIHWVGSLGRRHGGEWKRTKGITHGDLDTDCMDGIVHTLNTHMFLTFPVTFAVKEGHVSSFGH